MPRTVAGSEDAQVNTTDHDPDLSGFKFYWGEQVDK